MKHVLIVYRNNDLYNAIIPEIKSHFPEEVQVETLVFPQGTSDEEIKKHRDEKFSTIVCPTLFVSDNTCRITKITENIEKAKENGLRRMQNTFDDLLEKEIKRISDTSTDSFRDIFKKIALAITANPLKIMLVQESLKDHIWEAEVRKNPDTFIESYLKELYPNAKIEKVQSSDDAVSKCGNDEQALIIADRHTDIFKECWEIEKWPHKAKIFMLPFENAIRHLGIRPEFGEGINTGNIAKEIMRYIS